MKRIFIILPILSLVIACLSSCSTQQESLASYGKVDDFKMYGDLHNEYMNAGKNFVYEVEDTSVIELLDSLTNFFVEYTNENRPAMSGKDIFLNGLSKYRYNGNYGIFCPDEIKKKYMANGPRKAAFSNTSVAGSFDLVNDTIQMKSFDDLRNLISFVKENNCLSEETCSYLDAMTNAVESSFKGTLDSPGLQRTVKVMKSEIDAKQYPSDSETLNILGPILSISESSAEFWKEFFVEGIMAADSTCTEEEADSLTATVLNYPGWLAADVGGALMGAVGDAYKQWHRNGNSFPDDWDWGSTAITAGTGAVMASVGPEVVIGKWVLNGLKLGWTWCEDIFWNVIFRIW